MTRLSRLLVFSRFTRQKTRLFLLLSAIAAASCLVVWTVGGYQALFVEATQRDDRPLGRYDVKIGGDLSGGSGMNRMRERGGFGGPLSRRSESFSGRPNSGGPAQTGPQGAAGGELRGGGEEPMGGGSGGWSDGRAGARGGGSGGPEKGSTPATKRYDPLQSARVRDGSIVLERIPESIPDHIRERLIKADGDKNGVLSRIEERSFYSDSEVGDKSDFVGSAEDSGGGSERNDGSTQGGVPNNGRGQRRTAGRNPPLPPDLIDAVRRDPAVQAVDTMRTVRAFVFPENGGADRLLADAAEERAEKGNEDDSDAAYEEGVPEGIDPELHRRGLAAYRAGMGTPISLGESFVGIEAADPPDDLEEGRWFSPDRPAAREAVLGGKAAKRYNAKPNNRLLILTQTEEFQLTVVGILDDQHLSGFYVPLKTADEIADALPEIDSLGIVLTRSASPEEFKSRWEGRLAKGGSGATISTASEIARQREEEFKAASSFRLQAAAGTLLAILASIMIIFTSLSIGVEERRREIGLARAVGLSGRQIADSVLTESFLLAVPGWLSGLLAGWLILWLTTGKTLGLNGTTVGFSFLCAVVGSFAAAAVPMVTACRVRPLEAVADVREEASARFSSGTRRRIRTGVFLLGVGLIAFDLWLVYGIPTDIAHRAMLHSGIGMAALIIGVLCLIPTFVRVAEAILLPILATLLCFDRTVSASELSGHMKRTVGMTAMLSVGGGLFVLTQIWGYSMLDPFLPNRQMPDAFAAFLPVGLTEENAVKLREIPNVKADEFEPAAVEQAAFAPGSIPNGKGGDFANVVFFGMDVDRSFAGPNPLVTLRFIEGDASSAFEAMKNDRGVVITDSLQVDYGFKLGDTLRVSDPKKNARILEYPIVGIVAFNGWQWLSKTGGVRRNYGRSGGIAFASDSVIRSDYHLKDAGYFWFNLEKGADYAELERALDALARKNLSDVSEGNREEGKGGNAAYVKLSTRQSLTDSISGRADGVIWGLSAMPLATLVLVSVALIAVMVNSVRARRRSFGILRAVGVERSKLVRMILAESILLGLVAAGASLLFGIPAAAGALKLGRSMFGTADPEILFPVYGLTFGLGLLTTLAVAAALIPAIRIGTARPLELLQEGRGE